jgi:hypothetical protein
MDGVCVSADRHERRLTGARRVAIGRLTTTVVTCGVPAEGRVADPVRLTTRFL